MKTIILFARAPQRGRVKTRLARDIGDGAALGLYVAMLRDSLDKAEKVARTVGGEAILAHTPREAMEMEPQGGAPSLRDLWGGAAWAQPDGDLGAKMHGAIEWALGRGASAVALLGADVPDMSAEILAANFGALDERGASDLILEPARDGGFWTLMCHRPLPRQAFELDWSQDATREPLQLNLEALGLRASSGAPTGDDVDDLPALLRLCERLRQDPQRAPQTALWLRENEVAGVGA